MKNLILFSLLIISLSSCELEATQYEILIVNNTSHTLLLSYETKNKQEEVRLDYSAENPQFESIHIEPFDGVLPKYTPETFKEVVHKVKLSIILENGDTLALSKDFANLEEWAYEEAYDDQHIIHQYGLNLTDEDLEQ